MEELEAAAGLGLAIVEELGYVGESAGEAFAGGDTERGCRGPRTRRGWLVAALPGGLEGARQQDGQDQEEEPHALWIDGLAVHLHSGVGEEEPADEAAGDGATELLVVAEAQTYGALAVGVVRQAR